MIYTLQYLRALAVTMVVLSHLHFKSSVAGENVFSWFRIGATGVDIFFVISGFVMAMIYSRSSAKLGSAKNFWLRRLARILPMYWLVTSAALILYLVSPALVNANSGPTSIWRSYLLLPTMQQSSVQFLIGPGWSLSFELFFYWACTVLLLMPNRTLGMRVLVLTLVILAGGSLTGYAPSYLLTSPLLIEFAFGVVIFAWFHRMNGQLPVLAGRVLLVLGVLGFILLNLPNEFVLEQRWWRAGIPAAMLVAGALSLEEKARARLSQYGLLVGNASYSVYLTHVFVLGAASRIFGLLHLRGLGPLAETIYWLATLAVALAAGCYAYLWVERPITERLSSMIRIRSAESTLTCPKLQCSRDGR